MSELITFNLLLGEEIMLETKIALESFSKSAPIPRTELIPIALASQLTTFGEELWTNSKVISTCVVLFAGNRGLKRLAADV